MSVRESRCDERADVFSLGVVLWELVTQEYPRRGHLRDVKVPPSQATLNFPNIAFAFVLYSFCSVLGPLPQPPLKFKLCFLTL